jgi:hypothetical protein
MNVGLIRMVTVLASTTGALIRLMFSRREQMKLLARRERQAAPVHN